MNFGIETARSNFEKQATDWAVERISAEFGNQLTNEQVEQVAEYSYEVDNFDEFLGWAIRNALRSEYDWEE